MLKTIYIYILKLFPYYNTAKNNKIIIWENNKEAKKIGRFSYKINGLDINITGKNNQIILHKPFHFENYKIIMGGENNTVEIGKIDIGIANKNVEIYFAGNWNNRKIKIGDNTGFFGPCKLTITDPQSYIIIGENCIISHDVTFYTNDNHTIIKRGTKEILNKGYGVEIGNHCWIGHKATILKNVKIPDNTIIGAGAVVQSNLTKNTLSLQAILLKQ